MSKFLNIKETFETLSPKYERIKQEHGELLEMLDGLLAAFDNQYNPAYYKSLSVGDRANKIKTARELIAKVEK